MNTESIASRIKSNKRLIKYHSNEIITQSFDSKHNKKKKFTEKSNKTDFNSSEDKFETKLNDLNDDVLEEILQQLPIVDKFRCQTVCKRWHQSIDRLLSKQTALGMRNIAYDRSDCSLNSRHSVVSRDVIDRAVFELSDDVLNCDEFDLRNAIQRNHNQCLDNLRAIFTKCPKILSLDLRSIEISEQLIEMIVEYCPKLECLHLNSMVIRDSVWQSLTNKLSKRLIHLTIRNSIQLNQKSIIEHFIRSCNQLKCLKVTEWNESLHFNWFDYICDSVNEIHIACTSAKRIFNYEEIRVRNHIKRLKLTTFEALSQAVIDSIGQTFVNLSQIDLRNCEGFNKRSYKPIAQLTELTDLTMDLPFANCDEDFAILAKNCNKMKKIELNFGLLTLNSLQTMANNWTQLESASFRFVTIEKLNSEALDVFNNWKRLERLNLTGTNICDDINRVIQTSHSLRSLNLDLCHLIPKSVVDSFISCAKRNPKVLFELSVKETRINKFNTFKNINHISEGVVKINNLYIYYSPEDI